MPPYDYNDIRNDDWYNRLVRGVREKTTASVRRSGADPSDPYWRAKEQEGLSDLSNARQDAFRRALDAARAHQSMLGAGMREKEAARQRTISGALKSQWKPDVGLGVMPDSEEGQSGLGSSIPDPIVSSPGPSPDLYPSPMGQPRRQRSANPYRPQLMPWTLNWAPNTFSANPEVSAGYNPSVFKDSGLDYKKKRLDETYANLARRWM